MLETSKALITSIYIDGYNLYYGRLRGTQYKWLDVVALFSQITRSIEPASQIISVKFFTAPALPKFSRHGKESMRAQNDYHRALEATYPGKFEKVLGSHVYEKDGTKMPLYVEGSTFNKDNTVRVWRLVEKKTDVNLALSMYRDVNKRALDQVVLISNDSDTEPAISALIEDFPALKIGMIIPRGPQISGKKGRPASSKLISLTHWSRSYINDEELISAQLPEQVPTKKKPAKKPIHW
jgi:uncharacterized LabA/DUF88 family protein